MASHRLDPDLDKFIRAAIFVGFLVLLFTGIPGLIAQNLFGVSWELAFFVTWVIFPVALLALVMAVVLVKQRISPDLPK